MADFSQQAVHEFWHEYDDPYLYRVISLMESIEHWTRDGDPQFEAAMKRLEEAFDLIENLDLEVNDPMIQLVANVKTGRGLRLLMCMDMANPGSAAKVLMHAEETTESDNDIAGILLKRNVVFERLRLMSRVFAQDRFKLILKALEDSDYE